MDSRGDHRAACPTVGKLAQRAKPLEQAWARVCREAGARVLENCLLRDLNLEGVAGTDGRRLEVVANNLPLWNGAQLGVDCTLVSPLRRDGTAYPRAAATDGVRLEAARQRKENKYPELLNSRRCRRRRNQRGILNLRKQAHFSSLAHSFFYHFNSPSTHHIF